MKKIYFLYTLFLCCTISYSCTRQDPEVDVVQQTSRQNDLSILKALGYDTKGMIETEKYYMLLPDIIVSKSRIKEDRNAPKTRLTKTPSGFLNDTHQTVLIKDEYLSYFKDELHQAIEAWNNIGSCGLKFIIDNSAYDAMEVYAEYDGDGYEAIMCERPDKGKHGAYARINLSKFGYNAANLAKGMMMHVLGHIVGFEHTPIEYTANPPSNHIAGTADWDPNSIMRTEADAIKGINIWSGFTNSDKNGIRKVYPLKPATQSITCKLGPTTVTGDNLSLYETYEFTVKYLHPSCPEPIYEISVEPTAGYELTKVKNGVIAVEFMQSGSFTITAKVTNSSDQLRFRKTYTLPKPPSAVSTIQSKPEAEGASKNELYAQIVYEFTPCFIHPSTPNPIYGMSIKQSSGYKLSEDNKVEFTTPGTYDIIFNITNASKQLPLEFRQFEKTFIVHGPRRVRINGPLEIKLAEFHNFTVSYNDPGLPNPQFDISVKETYFNDPKYTLIRNSNQEFSIRFDDAGFYIIEASVKNRPDIRIGRYDISLFSRPPFVLGERVVKNDTGNIWEYATQMTIYYEDMPDLEYVQYRTVFNANIKINGIYFWQTREKIEGHLTNKIHATHPIMLEKESYGVIDLPVLQDIQKTDPFLGQVILTPYYSDIVFPENFAREYTPETEE